MNVVSRSGRYAFLVELTDGQAVVLDISSEPTVSQQMSVEAVATGGNWEAFDGDPGRLRELVRRVLAEGEELPAVGFDVKGRARRLVGVRVKPSDLNPPVVEAKGPGLVYSGHNGTFVFNETYLTGKNSETASAV